MAMPESQIREKENKMIKEMGRSEGILDCMVGCSRGEGVGDGRREMGDGGR